MSPWSEVWMTMSFTPAEPEAGRMIVTQFAPEAEICARTPPTSTLVMLPKLPLVIVIVLPPAYGPMLVESPQAEPDRLTT